jgi:type I restriction enzyme, S subunit
MSAAAVATACAAPVAEETRASYVAAPPLLTHLEHIAQAPDGVARLRELILSLAVQGKLVPQDPADEPASVLLERICAEKARLVKEGKIRKEKPLAEIAEDEKPFVLPVGWEWVRLATAVPFQIGRTPPTKETSYWCDNGTPWASITDMPHFGRVVTTSRTVSSKGAALFGYAPLPVGTLLMSFKLTIGKVSILDIPAYHNEAIASFSPLGGMTTEFLKFMLPVVSGTGASKNALMGATLNSASLANIVLALPPLAEQSRIVARVEELLALCDALEAKGKLEAEQHARLTGTLFDSLAASESAHALAENWQRVAAHFDLLLDRPEAVDALEQTILQLAVRGLLVPQDPADEPAGALLQKIRTEKDRLIAAGQIKRDKPLPPVGNDEQPFEVPQGWQWVRLATVGTSFDYGTSQKSLDIPHGTPVLRMGNVQAGKVELSNLKYFQDQESELPKLFLEQGDLLFNRTNSYELVGKTGIFRGEANKFSYASYLIRIRLNCNLANPDYINIYMNSAICRTTQIEPQIVQQNGQANFNGTKLQSILVPLPPLAEQSRIVARVAELRSLCADLRQRLTAARDTQLRLAGALVESVIH